MHSPQIDTVVCLVDEPHQLDSRRIASVTASRRAPGHGDLPAARDQLAELGLEPRLRLANTSVPVRFGHVLACGGRCRSVSTTETRRSPSTTGATCGAPSIVEHARRG